jgi:hypothetical protein
MEGTAVTKLKFKNCSFPAGECAALMATGLSRNTSVIYIVVQCFNARMLFDALAAALPSNSTLRRLELVEEDNDDNDCLSSIFSALGNNTGLKTLKVVVRFSMDESLSTAMKDGLGMNETLEFLELDRVHLADDPADLWCRAFSFLRTNKVLKTLIIVLDQDVTTFSVSAFRIDIAVMLQENTSLEMLSFQNICRIETIEAEEYIALVAALQHNTMLKTLRIYHSGSFRLTDDEDKQMASVLKKNFALKSLPDIDWENEVGDVGAILRLNEAGRRYLIEDGSSISKGVEVLIGVNNDINCVFLHLLENPRLCDRGAVEIVSPGESNDRSTSPTASSAGGKREQVSAHKEWESRRRLA